MKIIKPRNSEFNKWFLREHSLCAIQKDGELVTYDRSGTGCLRYYTLYAAYQLGLNSRRHKLKHKSMPR